MQHCGACSRTNNAPCAFMNYSDSDENLFAREGISYSPRPGGWRYLLPRSTDLQLLNYTYDTLNNDFAFLLPVLIHDTGDVSHAHYGFYKT